GVRPALADGRLDQRDDLVDAPIVCGEGLRRESRVGAPGRAAREQGERGCHGDAERDPSAGNHRSIPLSTISTSSATGAAGAADPSTPVFLAKPFASGADQLIV